MAEPVRPDAALTDMLKTVVSIAAGAIVGLAYQRFIGCRSGTCAITSNPWVSTLYGAFMGYLLSAQR